MHPRMTVWSALAMMAFMMPVATLAQSGSAGLLPQSKAASDRPLTVATPSENDLAALRYFVEKEDEPAIIAEQERLARRFPDADLDAITARLRSGEVIDTTLAWDLINRDRFDEARLEIARLQSMEASWHPPAEMVEVMRAREGESVMEDALQRRDLNAAVQAAQDFPELVTCARVNTPWRIAELMGDYQQVQPALDVYASTAINCTDINIVVASLQKGHGLAGSANWTRSAFAAAQERHVTHTEQLEIELDAFGRLVNYTGGRSNGCTTWSPTEAQTVLPLVEGNPTTLYLYPESRDIKAVARAIDRGRSVSGSGLYWNASCLQEIGKPQFWPKRSLQPVINSWRQSLPQRPPTELPICD